MLQQNELVQNILDVYSLAHSNDKKHGKEWYNTAHNICQDIAQLTDRPFEQVAGIMSALSPRCNWGKNVKYTYAAAQNKWQDVKTLHRNKDAAKTIANGADPDKVLSGPKVRAFYHNICNPQDDTHITVDSWAMRIAMGDQAHSGRIKPKEYEQLAKAYQTAAAQTAQTAVELQAIVWIVARNQYHKAPDYAAYQPTLM